MQNSQKMRELTNEELDMVAGGLDFTGLGADLGYSIADFGNYLGQALIGLLPGGLGAAVGSLLAGLGNAVGYVVGSLVSSLGGALGGL